MTLRRLTFASVGLAATLALGLAACSGTPDQGSSAASPDATAAPTAEATAETSPSAAPTDAASPSASPTPTIPASTNLDAVQVAGDLAAGPVVTVAAPWAINQSQNKVLGQGDGPLVLPGDVVRLDYVGVNGRTGQVFDSSFQRGQPAAFSLNGVVPGFAKGLTGQNVGSEVLLAMPSADGYGTSGQSNAGIQDGDSLIFYAHILAASRAGISGTVGPIPDGLPRVTGDPQPQVTLPAQPQQPTDLQAVTLITGDGPAVQSGGQLQVNYSEYAWNGGSLTFVRQTYGTSSGPIYASLSGEVVPAWSTSLAGVTEGSRVLIVSPPAQAYPNGNADIGVAKGSYSVWVVDVLFAG